MRTLVWTAMIAAAWGCAPSPPVREPARPKPELRRDDAREPIKRDLEARLAKVEAQLLAQPRSSELLRKRLELTIALSLLGREPQDVRPPSADTFVAKARERIEELARAKREISKRQSHKGKKEEREDADGDDRGPKRGEAKEDGYGYEYEPDPLGGPSTGGKDKPKQGGSEPPPPPPAEGAPGGVQAARVLPSAQGSSAEVSRQIERHADRLASCVPVMARASGLRCEVRVRLDERGRFREPRVVAADLDPRVGSCIADVFRDMRLDSPAGESRVVTVPLWLPPTP